MDTETKASLMALVAIPVVIIAGALLQLTATVTWIAAAVIAGAIYLAGQP